MVVPTPRGPQSPRFARDSEHLLAMVRAMAQVRVVRRWAERAPPAAPLPEALVPSAPIRLVTIAASTGGPAALQRILSELPRDFPVPILVVQHIAAGFEEGLAHWLAGSCSFHVTVAEHHEPLTARTVYLARNGAHLGVDRSGRAVLSAAPPIGGFRPAATHLFASAARAYGASLVSVILTGMGRDGVDGLAAVRAGGGRVLAQDEATSVVYGMPREAAAAGFVDAVLPLPEIATRLTELVSGDRA
jgi:two-component system chemotaxis response regulator CheB